MMLWMRKTRWNAMQANEEADVGDENESLLGLEGEEEEIAFLFLCVQNLMQFQIPKQDISIKNLILTIEKHFLDREF